MNKKMIMFFVLILMSSILFYGTGNEKLKNEKAFKLLEDLFTVIMKGVSGKTTNINFDNSLNNLANNLNQYKKNINDDIFYHRYNKLLLYVKFATQTSKKDKERLLWPIIKAKIVEYIIDKTGKKPDITDLKKMYMEHGNIGLGSFLTAAFNEIIDLHLYLKNKDKRKKIISEYMEKFRKWKKKKI